MMAWVKNISEFILHFFRYIRILQCAFNLFTHSKGKTKMIANASQLNYLSSKEKGDDLPRQSVLSHVRSIKWYDVGFTVVC